MSRIIFVVVITRLTRDHVNIELMYFSKNRIAFFCFFFLRSVFYCDFYGFETRSLRFNIKGDKNS